MGAGPSRAADPSRSVERGVGEWRRRRPLGGVLASRKGSVSDVRWQLTVTPTTLAATADMNGRGAPRRRPTKQMRRCATQCEYGVYGEKERHSHARKQAGTHTRRKGMRRRRRRSFASLCRAGALRVRSLPVASGHSNSFRNTCASTLAAAPHRAVPTAGCERVEPPNNGGAAQPVFILKK